MTRLTLADMALRIGIPRESVWRAILAGVLPARRTESGWTVCESDALAYEALTKRRRTTGETK